MPLTKPQIPRIIELADRIVADIRRRKLKPGDPYQTTLETAGMLGVSTTAANRAMQVLVKRRVLERRQRKGTFVANPAGLASTLLRKVHLLVHEDYLRREGLLSDGIVIGMHDELPAVQLQFSFMPPDGDDRHVQNLIHEALRSSQAEGFVLVRVSLAVQRAVAASGLPAVVHGQLHPSVPTMAWIDRDHAHAGRLLVAHLLEQGCRHIVVLMRDRMFRGDHTLLDAVRDAMAEARKSPSDLTLRCLPPDHEAIRYAVDELIDELDGSIGVLCRSEPLARGAEAAIATRKLRVPMVVSDIYRRGSDEPPRWPYLRPRISPEEIGRHIGRMLAQQARGEKPHPEFEIIDVQLATG